MKIRNHEDLVQILAAMLMQFDKECNRYQTDVYLYLDDEGNGSLDTFVNVGGNSWLIDNHYTIYSDKEHYDNHVDYYNTVGELADALGLTEDELRVMTVQTLYDPEDGVSFTDMNWSDVYQLIKMDDDLNDKIRESYEAEIDSMTDTYTERAEDILTEWEFAHEE